MDDCAFSRLLGKKQTEVLELLNTVKEWDETAPCETETYSKNISERQIKLDKVKRIDDKLKEYAGRKGFLPSSDDAEQIKKTNEMLRQIESIIGRDIKRMKSQMEEVSQEASKLRQRKSGIKAYIKNGLSARKDRVDIRG